MNTYSIAAIAGAAAASLALSSMGQVDSVSFNQKSNSQRNFLNWAAKNNKHFANSTEMAGRFQNWLKKDDFIANFSHPHVKVAHNALSDLSAAEFEALSGATDESKPLRKRERLVGARGGKNADGGDTTKCNPRKQDDCPCPARQWRNNSTRLCEDCGLGCATCTNSTTCTTCDSGFNNSSGTCTCPSGQVPVESSANDSCQACRSDQFINGEACADCGANCLTCGNAFNTCDSCAATFEVSNGQCVCPTGTVESNGACISCPSGTFLNGTSCSACDSKCATCDNSTTCLTCGQNYLDTPVDGICQCPEGSADNQTGCSACDADQYINGGLCVDCGQGCTDCNADGSACTSCAATFNLVEGACVCADDEVFNGTSCIDGLSCPIGSYNSATGCESCGIGCNACEDGTGACTSCVDPFVVVGG